MARLGVFGGTFDPPHLGHLILAVEAMDQLSLDKLLWVLTPQPPHKLKHKITPLQHRLDMLKASISGNQNFELSTVDIDRPGPHFAVDTMKIFIGKKPKAEWIYLMGGDSLKELHTWRNSIDLVKIVTALGVMIRPGIELDLIEIEKKTPGAASKLIFINAPVIGISASDIRKRVALGQPFRYLVTNKVHKIIQERQLYRLK